MSALTAPSLVTADSAPIVNFLGRDVTTLIGTEPGSCAFLPRGLPHAFLITEGPADLIQISNPAGFETFMAEVGPNPDPTHLAEVSRRHNIEILGPPLKP